MKSFYIPRGQLLCKRATLLFLLLLEGLGGLFGGQRALAQNCSTGGTPTVLASWTFDRGAPVNCNGAVGKIANGSAPLYQDRSQYCPTTNAGCGAALLGSRGHQNTGFFANAMCITDFYRNSSSLGNATSWDYTHPKNLRITYNIPSGKAACLSSMSLNILGNIGLSGFGVTVLRNGVPIDTQTFPHTTGVRTITWTGSSFCTDGSQSVAYTIYFGFWGSPSNRNGRVGVDDITLRGTCGGPPTPTLTATPATCGSGGVLGNGKIQVNNYATGSLYQYSLGTTFNAGAATPASPTAIPTGGVISSTLPNPTSTQPYTVRVYDAAGTCYQDQTVLLKATYCPIPCVQPTAATLASVQATCTGTTVNNNAQIQVTSVVGGNRVGISAGAVYTGVSYSTASTLTSGAFTFSSLANPTCGSQLYTVRIFNGNNDCYIDRQIEVLPAACAVCQKFGVAILGAGTGTVELNSANNTVCPESCKSDKYIDLELTKTVNVSTGVTCPSPTNFVWTLTLSNKGTMTAKNIQVSDLIPDGLRLVSSSPTAPAFTEMAGWLVDSLQANQSMVLTLTTQALRPGTFTNCAEVNAAFPLNDPDSTPGNKSTTEDDDACASITVTGPTPPTVTKEFSPNQTNINTSTRLTIKITNNEANPIVLTQNFIDNLPSSPAQMTIASTPNVSVSNGVPVIAAAGSKLLFIPSGTVLPPGLTQISVDVTVPADGQYCNVIPAGALQTSSCANMVADSACLDANSSYVLAPSIKKAFAPQIVQTNQNSTLTITVTNRNNFTLTLTQDFLDILPQGLVVAGAATSTCGTVAAVVGDSIISLVSGSVLQPGTCTIVVPVKSTTAGTYCNLIFMNSLLTQGNGQTNIGNQDRPEACLKVVSDPIFDLALRKTLAVGQDTIVAVGDTVSYAIRVFNQGTVDATNVQVTDYIPTGMSLVAGQGWTATSGKATLNTALALLAAGKDTTLNIKLKIDATFAGTSLVNRAEISAATGGTDVDSTPDDDPANDAGGKERTPSDDAIYGNGTGTAGDSDAIKDEDDADPAFITVAKCDNANLVVGVVLAPKSISTAQDIVSVTFGVVNTGTTPVSNVSFAADYKLFRGNATPTVLSTVKSGDVGNDGIMQPNESWLFTATMTNTPYKPGNVFLVSGVVKGLCFGKNIQAGGGDLLFTTGVNMDVEIMNKCAKPGDTLNVNLVTRLLIDEDAALNPGTVTIGGTLITLPKRRFEARNLRITTPLLNGGVAFDPFSPPSGLGVSILADQSGVDAGRNTNNILDESEPINTVRKPCTTVGENDEGCEFPDWVINLKVPVPTNFTGTSIILNATDNFDLYQSNENPAGSGMFDAFTSLGAAGGADADTAFVSQTNIVASVTNTTCSNPNANSDGTITLTGFGTGDRFDYVAGTTYTGTKTYATATAIPAGGVIVSNLSNPAAPQSYTVRVFDVNGCFKDLTVVLQPVNCCVKPNAGSDQTGCAGTSATLTGTAPTTGTWSAQTGNPAGATLGATSAGVATVAFASNATGTYHFIYSIGAGCQDTMSVMVNAKPNAGADQTLVCANAATNSLTTSTTLVPVTAGGTFTQIGMLPAVATIAGNAISGMSVAGTYFFQYRVAGCLDTVAVTVQACAVCTKPNAGADQALCMPTTTTTLTGSPAGGSWSVQTGNPAVATVSSAGAVSGMSVAGTYRFIYSVTSGGQTCSDTVAVVLNAKPNAGADQTLVCANAATNLLTTSTTLVPVTAGGTFTQIGTLPAVATIAGNAISGMSVAGTYFFQYRVAGCLDTVAVTVQACAVCTKPNAGADQALCMPTTTTTLTGSPAGGSWSVQTGNPAVATVSSAGAVSGMSVAGTYRFIYSVTSGGQTCSDTVAVVLNAKPNAGVDQTLVCANAATNLLTTSTTLVPVTAGGTFTQIGMLPAVATIAGNAISGMSVAGTYFFQYRVAGCLDTVAVTVQACAVCTKPNAGADQALCMPTTTTTLTGSPAGGSWSVQTGNPAVATVSSAGAVSGMSVAGTYRFIYSVTSGGQTCSDTVAVVLNAKPNAGADQTLVCANAATNSLTTSTTLVPVTAGGTFTQIGMLPAVATIAGNAISGMSVAGTYFFQYRVAGCLDTVAVTVQACAVCTKPNAGADITLTCPSSGIAPTTTTLTGFTPAGGTWAAQGNNPAVATVSSAGAVSGMSVAGTYRFIYSVTSGGQTCSDTVAVVVPTCVIPKGSLGDFVWKDTNNNGLQDETTTNGGGVAGVIIELYKNGTLLTKDTTDATGKYLFTNLDAGTYKIKIVSSSLPVGCEISGVKDAGTDDGKDSDVDKATGFSGDYVITPTDPTKKDILTVDAALAVPCVKSKVTLTGNPVCSSDVQTYSITFSVMGKNGIVKVNKGTLTGSNPYTVTGIPSGSTIKITDSLSAVCKFDTLITGPNCNCNPPLPKIGASSLTACIGDTFPTMKATIVGLATVEWFTQSTGGTAVFTGLNYKPAGTVSAAGAIFYAQARSTDPTCPTAISIGRVAVTVNAQDCVKKVDLALKKSINTKVARIGDTLTYTIKVWNQSNTNATGVEVTDTIATTIQFQTGSFMASRGSAVITGNVIKWVIGNVAANGDTVTLTYRVKATQEGIHFNTAEISKLNEKDTDSTPGNGKDEEDDIDRQCFTVPLKLCPGEKVQVNVPNTLTDVKWFKNGGSTAVATGNEILLAEIGTYTFMATNQTCPANGCCPIIIEAGVNCCPEELCIPFTIKKSKKGKK